MTTAGLKAALLEAKVLKFALNDGEDDGDDDDDDAAKEELEVGDVEVFYPFEYGPSFFARQWDLVIIEGWFLSINSFLHEVWFSFDFLPFFGTGCPPFPCLHIHNVLAAACLIGDPHN